MIKPHILLNFTAVACSTLFACARELRCSGSSCLELTPAHSLDIELEQSPGLDQEAAIAMVRCLRGYTYRSLNEECCSLQPLAATINKGVNYK